MLDKCLMSEGSGVSCEMFPWKPITSLLMTREAPQGLIFLLALG